MPLIIVGVIGFVSIMIVYARHEGRKELQAAQEYSQDKGWSFTHYDEQGLKERIADIWCDLKFDLYYIRGVETGKRQLFLFDCLYKHKEATVKSRERNGTACMIQSERFGSITVPVKIVTRDWTEVFASDKVDMGNSPFAKNFLVLSKDAALAKEIVSPSIQMIMLEYLQKHLNNPVSIDISPSGVVVLMERTYEHEHLQDLIALARQVESAVK